MFEVPRLPGGTEGLLRHTGLLILLGVEHREVPANDLLDAVALDALGAGIPATHVAARIEHVDGVIGGRVYEKPELLLTADGGC